MNCAPRCIVWLEAQYGRKLTLKASREYCGTMTRGTYYHGFVRGLNTLGYKNVRIRENLTWGRLRDLTRRNHVFVGWVAPKDVGTGEMLFLSKWGEHFSPVLSVNGNTITLHEPYGGIDLQFTKDQFDLLWRDEEIEPDGYYRPFIHAAVVCKRET